MRKILLAVAMVLLARIAAADVRIERNVVYGMYSGLALLMDVHHPERANGLGIIVIPGSGFHSPQVYNATALKTGVSVTFVYTGTLLDAGYTLFVINHRQAPRFHYPAAVEDAQRAVRFVRFHASDYGIQPDRIGAVGASSGAYLSTLLGLLPGDGNRTDADAIERVSARLQCVVAISANGDLAVDIDNNPNVVSFMGMLPPEAVGARNDPTSINAYHDASPINHTSKSGAPLLLIHGDADETIPIRHAEMLLKATQSAGGVAKLVRVPGGDHRFGFEIGKHPEWPDVFSEMKRWFEEHLTSNRGRR